MTRPCGVDAARFDVLGVHAGVADVRIGQRDDLPAVRGIGEDFLVAGHRGVEHHLADGGAVRADGTAAKDRPVGKDQHGGFEVSHFCSAREKRESRGTKPCRPSRFIEGRIIGPKRRPCRTGPGFPLQELDGAQRALGVGRAALRAHRDLDALAGAGEHHRVLADDVAAADRMEADLRRLPLAGNAFAAEDEILFVQSPGDDLAQLQRRAGRRVDLVAVVRLDDLDVVAVAEDAGRDLGQLVGRVDADGEVRRHHDRDALRRLGDAALVLFGEAGGADHHRSCVLEVRERALGPGEVDQHVRLRNGAEFGSDLGLADRLANRTAAFHVQRSDQRQLLIREHGVDQRASHAPAGAGDRDFHGSVLTAWRRRRPRRRRGA